MALRDCPLCCTRVLVGRDGACPACGGAIAALADGAIVTMSLTSLDVLPPFCASCAAPTERVEVLRSVRRTAAEVPWWAALLVFFFSPIRGVGLLAASAPEVREVVVRVPRCEACARGGALSPERADFDQERLTVRVHREFRALVGAARR